MPRTGSTLLLDILATHPDLWSWEAEAYEAWDAARPAGHPDSSGDTWPVSYATPTLRVAAEHHLLAGVTKPLPASTRLGLRSVRFLEKTPATVLRVPVLAAVWPDARFVFLHRDAPANVASNIEAWEKGLAVRRRRTSDGCDVEWGMLMPAGWEDHLGESIAARCAWAWEVGNRAALDAFATIDADRVARVAYEDLCADTVGTVRRLIAFAELPWCVEVETIATVRPESRVVLSAPRPSKWRERAVEMAPHLHALAPLSIELGYDPESWALGR